MKKLLIRLTGLMVTAAIVLSTGGMALAAENEGQVGESGVKTEQPAEIPSEEEPEKAPAEDPAGDSKEEPAKEEAPAKAEEPAAPAKDEKAPAEDPKTEDPANGNDKETDYRASTTVSVKLDKSNDELAQDYINHVFGKTSLRKRSANYTAGLSEQELTLYNYMREKIELIASGDEAIAQLEDCPKVTYSAEELGLADMNDLDAAWEAAQVKFNSDFFHVIDVLVQACPYDLYWFDKTAGAHISYGGASSTNGYSIRNITIQLTVAEEYTEDGDTRIVDTTYGKSAVKARDNAMAVISEYASLDDYQKLKAYKNKICELTDYNDYAASHDIAYGNPWQMIWVFDGKPETKVVCEGYSKAFQFLCDNSTFQSSEIYAMSVSGTTYFSANNYGPHMWNIVHMDDGKYYLVDVTNCDTGFSLFLRGKSTTQSVNNGYYIDVSDNQSFKYIYGKDVTFIDIATKDYSTNQGPITEPEFTADHSMILAGKIGLRFLVDFPENYDTSSCYVVFTSSDGRTFTVNYANSETIEGQGNKRSFTFYMNALELADTVTATLHYGDGKTTTDAYSVISYISDIKSSVYGNNFNLMNLMYKLQAYGYYLQNSGWTDGRTHKQIPIPVSTLIENNIPKTIIVDGCLEDTINAVSSYGMTLTQSGTLIDDVRFALALNSETDLRIAVKPASGVTITSDASEYTVVTIGGEKYYVFTVVEIGPKKLGDNKNVTIKTDKGNATISVSPIYYVKQVLNSSSFDTNQKNAMIAYYNYFDAAKRYK